MREKTLENNCSFSVVPGRGAASGLREYIEMGGSIRAQTPYFREVGLDVGCFHPATINAQIKPLRWKMKAPLFSTKAIKWHPDFPPEDFDFAAAAIEFLGQIYPSLVYFPRPETKLAFAPAVSESIIEILAPFVADIEYGSTGKLFVNPCQIEFFR
jgi:hypothetical protein